MSKKTAKKARKNQSARPAVTKTQPRPTTADLSAALKSVSSSSATSTSTALSPHMNLNQLLIMALTFALTNALVLYLANRFFPAHVVLGTYQVSMLTALVSSSIVSSVLATAATPIIEMIQDLRGRNFADSHWIFFYFVINSAIIWGIARFSEILGLGISSWAVALCLGFIINLIQGMLVVGVITPLTSRDA